jgi:hypothetical protein
MFTSGTGLHWERRKRGVGGSGLGLRLGFLHDDAFGRDEREKKSVCSIFAAKKRGAVAMF